MRSLPFVLFLAACPGTESECDLVGEVTWFTDVDGDGWGGGAELQGCAAPAGSVEVGGDCDDTDEAVHPEAEEHCDGVDEDCDGATDEDPVDPTTWYADVDGDGFGDPGAPIEACDPPADAVTDDSDCDDSEAAVNPGEVEGCGVADEDCNPATVPFVVGVDGTSVQATADAAPHGGLVCLPPGRWSGGLSLSGRTLRIGGQSREASALLGAVALDGSAVEIRDLALIGFPGGPALTVDGGSARLTRVDLAAADPGAGDTGGLLGLDAALSLEDVAVSGPRVDRRCGPGSSLDLAGTTMAVIGGSLDLREVTLSGLDVENIGACDRVTAIGLALSTYDVVVTGEGVTLRDGTIDLEATDGAVAGGFVAALNSTVAIDGLWLSGLHLDAAGTVFGGAVAVDGGSVELAHLDARAIDVRGTGEVSGGVLALSDTDTTLANVVLGGVSASSEATVLGGAVWQAGGSLSWRYASVHGVTCSGPTTGCVAGVDAAPGALSLDAVTFSEVVAADPGAVLTVTEPLADLELTVRYCNVDFVGSDPFGSTVETLPAILGVDGNGANRPHFLDVTGDPRDWDLHLTPGSPIEDAADPADSDPDGSRADIGAYGGPGGAW